MTGAVPAMFGRLIQDLKDRVLWRLLRENFRAQAGNYAIAIVAMLVIAASTAGTAWIMKDAIDALGTPDNRSRLLAVAGGVAAIFIVKGLATYIQTVFLARAGNSIVAEQQRRIYDKLLRHGVSYFKSQASSDLLMQVTYSAQSARQVIETMATGLVRDLLTLLGLLAVMIYQQPALFMISLVFGPLAMLGLREILKRIREVMNKELASLTEIINVVQETSIGIRVIKAFALEDRMAARMNTAVEKVEQRSNSITRLQAATSPLVETLSGVAIAAVIALSTTQFFGTQITGPGQLMSFLTALLMAYDPARRVAQMRVQIETSMVGVNMLFRILDEPVTLVEAPDAVDLPKGPGEVRFDHVSFGYQPDQPVLSDISLTFAAGKTTALVGPSGGGKSSLINLVMRLYDPTEGRVLIDGVPLTGARFASLRQRISFVGQDTFLFTGTVLHNIGLGREDATEAEIIAAARAANAHEFIEKMSQGYQTQIGENGGNLSGGQRQRLAIARALLRDAPILLLDEATSALDSVSEALVQEALGRLSAGRTTIVIAHRLSTVMTADSIVVLEAGRVVQHGAPAELLRQQGTFQRLHELQFGSRASGGGALAEDDAAGLGEAQAVELALSEPSEDPKAGTGTAGS